MMVAGDWMRLFMLLDELLQLVFLSGFFEVHEYPALWWRKLICQFFQVICCIGYRSNTRKDAIKCYMFTYMPRG
jgi:hypothetical protein